MPVSLSIQDLTDSLSSYDLKPPINKENGFVVPVMVVLPVLFLFPYIGDLDRDGNCLL